MYKITNVVKLRDFQYRLLHKRVPSKKELFHWKIKKSYQCIYCGKLEDIKHLLYSCSYVTEIWQKWIRYVQMRYQIRLEFTFETIIVNTFVEPTKHIVNFLGLILKQLIYRYNCKEEKLRFEDFLNEVGWCEQAEYYKAKVNNKVAFHNDKWGIKDDRK